MRRRLAAPADHLGQHPVEHRLDLQCAADAVRRRDRRRRDQRRRLPARGRPARAHVDLRPHPAASPRQCPTAAQPVLLATGQPQHQQAARRRSRRSSAVPARPRRVHGDGPGRRDRLGCRLPGRLQPAPADRHPGDVAARRRLRRQGGAHLRDQPRAADPVRATRAARRRRIQRHARPLHRARPLDRAQPLVRSARSSRREQQRQRPAPRPAAAAGVQGHRPRAAGRRRRELQADPGREDPLSPGSGLPRPPAASRRSCRR